MSRRESEAPGGTPGANFSNPADRQRISELRAALTAAALGGGR
jgi:hypothetical protein